MEYDIRAKEIQAHGHEILFGLCYEYVKPGCKLLDIGIGTGMSSEHFAKAGAEIYGIDNSAEMLDACSKKGFARELKQFDLGKLPLPYENDIFDIAVCCGVFHFFAEIEPIVKETSRVLRQDGYFGFTVAVPKSVNGPQEGQPLVSEIETPWDTNIFAHSDRSIENISLNHGFEITKHQMFYQWSESAEKEDLLIKLFVLQKS